MRCTGPGRPLARGPERAAGELAHPAQPLGRRGVVVDLEEPLGRAAVELDLVDRLAGADVAQLGRAVGGEHEQRHARLVRLDHRGRVVGGGGARRAGEHDRRARSPSPARGAKKPPQRSSMCEVARIRAVADEREHERRRARARRRARVAHAAARELVDERAQAEVGVGRVARAASCRACPRRSSSCTASPQTGRSWRAASRRLWRGTLSGCSRPTSRATATRVRPRGPRRPSPRRDSPYVGALRAPERFALCGYSMGGRIALHVALRAARARRAARAGRRRPRGSPTPPSARARRAADEALADAHRGDRRRGVRAASGARSRCSPASRAQVAAAAHADRLRNTPAGLAAALRGLGTGAMEPLWDRLGELAMPVTLVVGERDAKFADRRADGRALRATRRGRAARPRVQLERPTVARRLPRRGSPHARPLARGRAGQAPSGYDGAWRTPGDRRASRRVGSPRGAAAGSAATAAAAADAAGYGSTARRPARRCGEQLIDAGTRPPRRRRARSRCPGSTRRGAPCRGGLGRLSGAPRRGPARRASSRCRRRERAHERGCDALLASHTRRRRAARRRDPVLRRRSATGWERGRGSRVAQEHFAAELLGGRLRGAGAAAGTRGARARARCSRLPARGERHDLGPAVAAADRARADRGWRGHLPRRRARRVGRDRVEAVDRRIRASICRALGRRAPSRCAAIADDLARISAPRRRARRRGRDAAIALRAGARLLRDDPVTAARRTLTDRPATRLG